MFAKNLRYLRHKYGLSQDDIANLFNLKSFTTIQKWEKGTSEPSFVKVVALADHFHVPVDDLVKEDLELKDNTPPADLPGVPVHRIPILGRIAAGLPLYADENIEGYTYTALNGGSEYFALRVHGDSMNAASINDGDLIVCRRQDQVEDNEIAVVLVDSEEATVKRFRQQGRQVYLYPQSTNPAHLVQMYDLRDHSVRIQGKVIKVEHDVF